MPDGGTLLRVVKNVTHDLQLMAPVAHRLHPAPNTPHLAGMAQPFINQLPSCAPLRASNPKARVVIRATQQTMEMVIVDRKADDFDPILLQ